MTTEETRQFIGRYIEAMTGGDSRSPEVVAKYIDDEALIEHIAMFDQAFPGYSMEVHDTLVDGDKAILRATFHGVHKGPFQGVAPTNREVSTPLLIVYRIENGKIVEHWMQADILSLMRQLDAMPTPA